MKKLFVILSLFIVCYANNAQAQCNLSAPTGVAGFSPSYNDLPCIERGVAYNQSIEFEMPQNIGGALTVEWIEIDSIAVHYDNGLPASFSGLPDGINWSMNVPSGNPTNRLLGGERGCINFSGTTNDNIGDYRLGIYVCAKFSISSNPLCGEICELLETINSLGSPNPYFNSIYYLRLIDSGGVCDSVPAPSSCYYSSSLDSIDIVSFFVSNYAICVGDTVDIFVNHQGGSAPYTYTWSNNAGNVNAITVSPLITTNYSVTVTDANGNSSFDDVTINVGSQPSNIISGKVRLSNNDSVPDMKVLLVQIDSSSFNISAVDSTLTDASGYFSFNYIGNKLFVKAIPDSTLYPNEMPTYHYGATEAFPFMLLYDLGLSTPDCGNNSLFFNTISGNNPGGNGFISGNIFQGAGKRQNAAAVGQYVFLVNSNNQPVDYAITNADGYFSFSNIALADYRIFVDVPNFNVNAAPTVSLNTNSPSSENLQYYLEDLVSSVVLKQFTKINEVLLFPNPTNGQVTVMSELNVDINEVSLVITDIQGKQINESTIKLNGKKLETTIDLSTYEKGCYFIQLKANDVVVNKKLMVY